MLHFTLSGNNIFCAGFDTLTVKCFQSIEELSFFKYIIGNDVMLNCNLTTNTVRPLIEVHFYNCVSIYNTVNCHTSVIVFAS